MDAHRNLTAQAVGAATDEDDLLSRHDQQPVLRRASTGKVGHRCAGSHGSWKAWRMVLNHHGESACTREILRWWTLVTLDFFGSRRRHHDAQGCGS